MAKDGVGRPTKAQAAEKKKVNRLEQVVASYDREFSRWEARVNKINKRYRDDRLEGGASQSRFNILWSNVQTLIPATFSRLPQPDVSRRFRDNDPVGRVAGLILERASAYEIDFYPDYRATLKECIQDRFLGARGSAWARYEPHIKAVERGLPTDGAQVTEDTDDPDEELDYECAPVDYVHWKDFGHNVARTWEEVTIVWRKVYMTRDACVERFGEELGNEIPLDSHPETDKMNKTTSDNDTARALVLEFWNKATKEATWFSQSLGKILDEKDDPLQLDGFFPCPKPLYGTLTNDTLVPVPDYAEYQDQAQSLDVLSDRIDGLIRALKVRGVYDGSVGELKRLFTEGNNNDLIPVNNWQAFSEKSGLKGALDLVDLAPIAAALKEAYLAFHEIKGQIDEMTGLADIIRGQTNPQETLGAQQLKSNYASLRLKDYQQQVAMFATEILRIKAQIICNKFDPQTICKMAAVEQLSAADKALVFPPPPPMPAPQSGMPPPAPIPQAQPMPTGPAMQLLLGKRATDPECDECPNIARSFRIDIAADTLVQLDEQAEKQSRTEFLSAVAGYLQKALPVVQASPQAASLVIEMLKFGVTGFKVGKQLEGTIDQALDQLNEAAKQPKPAPPPDPAVQVAQIKEQGESQARQQEAAIQQQQDQREWQLEQQRMQAEERRQDRQDMMEQNRQMMEDARAKNEAMMQATLDRWEIMFKGKVEIEKAEIAADAVINKPQIGGAEQASK